MNRLGEQDLTILGTKLYLNLQGVFFTGPPYIWLSHNPFMKSHTLTFFSSDLTTGWFF